MFDFAKRLTSMLAAIGVAGSLATGAAAHGPEDMPGRQGMTGPGMMMGPGAMMGRGPMEPGMTGQGQWPGGMMMGPGMMGPGMMGPGMMGPGMMGPGMMGPGMMGPGMMGPGMMGGYGNRVVPNRDLKTDDVRHFLEHRIEWQGYGRLKVGDVAERDKDTIVAEVVTDDGTLVQRLEIDRHTGAMTEIK